MFSNFLDIGCGEGHTLNYFREKRWEAIGLDFSDSGIKNHNPKCLDNFIAGDIYDNIEKEIDAGNKYHLIWLDNVLEHVINPLDLLEKCKKVAMPNCHIIIEVPNDFSRIQIELKEKA